MIVAHEDLERLISERRTSKPAWFEDQEPDHSAVRRAIEVARRAPNHHRTEPARFYLLDRLRIKEVGKLFGETLIGDDPDDAIREKATRKELEWGRSPGLLVVTCLTDRNSDLFLNKPEIAKEDYATCACICQNLSLLLHNLGIASKWSTGPVWKHPRFAEVVGLFAGEPDEQVVALMFYGICRKAMPNRAFSDLDEHLKDYVGGSGLPD